MTFGTTYEELSNIINFYLQENDSEEMDITTLPLDSGLLIHVRRFDTGSITLKGKIEFRIDSFEDDILTIRLKFRNIFYELLKKVLMGLVMKILIKNFKQESEDVDPMEFVHFRSNTISVETARLFKTMNIPIDLLVVRQKEGSLIVAFSFVPERMATKDDQ